MTKSNFAVQFDDRLTSKLQKDEKIVILEIFRNGKAD